MDSFFNVFDEKAFEISASPLEVPRLYPRTKLTRVSEKHLIPRLISGLNSLILNNNCVYFE